MRGSNDLSFVEKVASYFRRPVKLRNKISFDTVLPHVEGKTILELGCGSGFFAFDICRNSNVKKIIGIDISENAINRAKKISYEEGLSDKCEFYTNDAMSQAFPEADITVGLGFLDYLTAEEVGLLFRNIRSEYFLFSLSQRIPSVLRYIHILYLLSQQCPKHFYYTKDEFFKFVDNKYSNISFIDDKRLSFACIVHNLPINQSTD